MYILSIKITKKINKLENAEFLLIEQYKIPIK
jgi:hypothetical protein